MSNVVGQRPWWQRAARVDAPRTETPTHRELAASGGRYAKLWDAFHRTERSLTSAPSTRPRLAERVATPS